VWVDTGGLVFTNTIGTPLDAHNAINRPFKPPLRRAGLPIRWHDLRHSAAMLLLAHSVHPKLVQYARPRELIMTLDRYSHWILSMGRASANAIADALKGDEATTDEASG
jgi:integrase